MKPIESMALVVNPSKSGARELAEEICRHPSLKKDHCLIMDSFPLHHSALDDFDVCCVIGGDGTILGVVAEAFRAQKPILGVNLGKLGFLATYTPDEIRDRIGQVIAGDYCTDQRSVIRCKLNDGSAQIALNDLVIKGNSINLIRLKVFHNEKRVAEYNADGLIFATSTGSTAYNLSAGGPILHPQTRSIAMTPICAHTLSNRGIIFPETAELRVECDCDSYLPNVSVDGRPLAESSSLFPMEISVEKDRITLLHDPDYSHYQMLRTKLNWV
ncbi:MAG: NAD(+)/NADH kinase [Opitutales bacterium]|nr:NAD(+)/NADH kinase [Opitutales bacterium]